MRVAIHLPPDMKASAEFIVYEKILQFNQIDSVRVHIDDQNFWQKVKECDAFIFNYHHFDDQKQIATAIMPIIEEDMHIKCFPNRRTAWHYDDKIRQYYLLNNYSIPMIESWVFYNKDDAINWAVSAQYPVVFKLKNGAGASNVVLINNLKDAKKIIKWMFFKGAKYGKLPITGTTSELDFDLKRLIRKSISNLVKLIKRESDSKFWAVNKAYVYFQKFIPENLFDIRVITIGRYAFGVKRLNRKGDFRASGFGNWISDPAEVDLKFIVKAFEVSDKLNFQCMAYDFLTDENGEPVICEISHAFKSQWYFEKCTGFWDKDLNWHEGHFWPQYLQLMEFLGLELSQPENIL